MPPQPADQLLLASAVVLFELATVHIVIRTIRRCTQLLFNFRFLLNGIGMHSVLIEQHRTEMLPLFCLLVYIIRPRVRITHLSTLAFMPLSPTSMINRERFFSSPRMMSVSLACVSAMILLVGLGTMMWATVDDISPAIIVVT